MKKVTTIVLNGFTNDSRVLKENLSLKKAGYDVKILALHKEGLKEFEVVQGIPIHRLSMKKSNLQKQTNLKEQLTEEIKNADRVQTSNAEAERFVVDPQDKTIEVCIGEKGQEGIDNALIVFAKKFVGWLRKQKRRLIGYKNKFLNKFFKLHRMKFNLLFAKECKDSDIIHCNDLLTLPMGVIVKKFYNKDVKIVYDAHEYETELNGLSGRKKFFRKLLERSLIRYADKVITVSNAIANEYVRLYNIEKPALVLNTPSLKTIIKKNIFREKFGILEDKIVFLYQGGLVNGRGIEDILESFKGLNDSKGVVVFMGYGRLEETIEKYAQENDNIFYHPAVSPDVLLDYTSSADFGISMIEDICLSYRYCLPNKMFEYIMAEVPVIVSNLPEMRKVVDKYKVGVVAKHSGIKGLEEAIIEATKMDKSELIANIREAKKIFNWEEQEKVLLKTYEELA